MRNFRTKSRRGEEGVRCGGVWYLPARTAVRKCRALSDMRDINYRLDVVASPLGGANGLPLKCGVPSVRGAKKKSGGLPPSQFFLVV
jgi:hypothetical protein